ncbi:Uma2 family endonuclease [Streptomyces sp. NPDC008238]
MTDFFENLQVPEGAKVELLRGEIVMTSGPDLVHNDIIDAMTDRFPRTRWRRSQTQDIAIPEEASEPQLDLVILERGAGPASGRLLPSEAVTLVAEVLSRTSAHRDHVVKRSLYAAGKVPVHVFVDPLAAKCVVLTEPAGTGEQADYRAERTWKFGESVRLPVVGVVLDTSKFGVLPGLTPGP